MTSRGRRWPTWRIGKFIQAAPASNSRDDGFEMLGDLMPMIDGAGGLNLVTPGFGVGESPRGCDLANKQMAKNGHPRRGEVRYNP
jgi:hypothetical protein